MGAKWPVGAPHFPALTAHGAAPHWPHTRNRSSNDPPRPADHEHRTCPTLDLNDPEFTLAPADFERIRQLIYQRAGISLHAGKQAMVYSRLARRLRETRHTGFSSYLQWLEKGAPDSEWQEFVNCLTTNLTSFFREDHHFLALVEDLRARASRPLRIWCNAASTGEEPYSLAMTAVETLGVSAQVKLVCSDIDTNVLETARRGVYNADARGLSPERLRRHFLRGTGSNAGSIRVKPELARLIEFRSFNLMSREWGTLGEPVRHRVLPQRDDLLRRPHAAQGARADPPCDAPGRPAVRGPFRELHRFVGHLPPARQDHLRARVKPPSAPL
jgi:chemotaxis protein methyltransferase CheR